jgi:glycosyltransferase involved in cell wall biosynthesis
LGISEYQNGQLQKFGFRRELVVIPWGADPSLFPYYEHKTGKPLKILHVGNLVPVKDQLTLLKAFIIIRRTYPAQIRMIGTDLLQGALQNFCRESGIWKDVEFLEMQPYHRMPAHYEWADLMLHTALSEGQCMALTEAAATGVLVAGTRVGLLHDLGEESAVTVETGDHEGLAAKILGLLADRKAWDQKIGNARKWSAEHDLGWTADQLTRLLNQY